MPGTHIVSFCVRELQIRGQALSTAKLTAFSFGIAAEDWNVLQTARPNVLLIGADTAVTGFLEILQPLLQTPVVHITDGTFATPPSSAGTLILRDVSQLDTDSQDRLAEWLSASDRRTQVISTSPCPLYPFVERSELSAPLYYSLNVIMIALRDPAAY